MKTVYHYLYMPEIPFTPHAVRRAANEFKNLYQDFMKLGREEPIPEEIATAIIQQEGLETVGIGNFRVIVPHPIDPEHKVVGIDYKTNMNPELAKRFYFSHQILHALFPQNFPEIYASHATIYDQESREMIRESSTVRERIIPATPAVEPSYPQSTRKRAMRAFRGRFRHNNRITAPFSDAMRVCNELGIRFNKDKRNSNTQKNFDFDPKNANNFIVGRDGGEYYIEPISIDTTHPLNSERITNYMRGHQYSDPDIQRVQRGIQKLTAITQQPQSPFRR